MIFFFWRKIHLLKMARLTLFGVVFLTVKVLVSISRVKEKRFVIPYLINQNFINKKWRDFCWGRNFYRPIFSLSHSVHKLLHRDKSFCQIIFLSATFLTQVVVLSLDKNIFWICREMLALDAQNRYASCPNFDIWWSALNWRYDVFSK